MPPTIRIHDIKTILTQPGQSRLAIVKVITTEPGLYGLGCATFTQRIFAVQAAIERHLKPFLIGRDVDRIEEIWQMAMVHAYWRNGPVLNNAISGVDQALWDIKGKRAGMPLYQLLGGKTREASAVYVHADGRDPREVAANVEKFVEQGFRYVRVQMGGYGGQPVDMVKPEHAADGNYFDPRAYSRSMLNMIEYVRGQTSQNVELLHDVHERLHPVDAVQFAKDVEPYKLFFLEDVLAPEDIGWFKHIRQQCATPLAMGELLNNPHEWRKLLRSSSSILFERISARLAGSRQRAIRLFSPGPLACGQPGMAQGIPRRLDMQPTSTSMSGLRISAFRNGTGLRNSNMRCFLACHKCGTGIYIQTICLV